MHLIPLSYSSHLLIHRVQPFVKAQFVTVNLHIAVVKAKDNSKTHLQQRIYMNTTIDLKIHGRKSSLQSGPHSKFILNCTQVHISSGQESSVHAFLPQVVQLRRLVQVHVHVHIHHSPCRVPAEVCCDLVESLAPCLWHPEECEDEEEEEESCEDQEDVRPTKVLRKDGIRSNNIRIRVGYSLMHRTSTGIY